MHLLAIAAILAVATGAIALGPIVSAIVPFVIAVVGAFASYALHKLAVKYHLDALDSHREVLINAITAGINFAAKAVPANVQAPSQVAAVVNYVLPKVPQALAALKVTPDALAQMITARLPA